MHTSSRKVKMHKIAWETLCKPKLEGGIGIKKFTDLALTSRIKLIWKFLTTDSLWSRWMRTKYLSKANFWVMAVNNNYSGTFKSTLRQRGIAIKIMNRVIVNGEHKNLWFDLCINHKSLVDLIGWNRVSLNFSFNNNVSLIVRDRQLQPLSISKTREVSSKILQVKLSRDDTSDYWIITNQKFVFASVWDGIRVHVEKDDNYFFIWHNKTAIFFVCCLFGIQPTLADCREIGQLGNECTKAVSTLQQSY